MGRYLACGKRFEIFLISCNIDSVFRTCEEGYVPVSIKVNGKQIENPVAQLFIVALLIVVLVGLVYFLCYVVMPVVVFAICLTLLVLVLTIPFHFMLRLCGRRGFYIKTENGYSWDSVGATKRLAS